MRNISNNINNIVIFSNTGYILKPIYLVGVIKMATGLRKVVTHALKRLRRFGLDNVWRITVILWSSFQC